MAARLKLHHQDDIRQKIQATKLINRLQAYALGETEKVRGPGGVGNVDRKVVLTTGEIRAIEILLNKAIPDLKSIEIDTAPGGLKIVMQSADIAL